MRIISRRTWTTIFVVTAIIYNPIFRFHATRDTWAIVNIATPSTFGAFIQFFRLGLDFSKTILDKPWKPNESDENAAWAMYVEMVTRVITQPLPPDSGDEKTEVPTLIRAKIS